MSNYPLENVRVRFAPSPTGYLHVGGARTALYCYLFAKRHNGSFILRVEDTDEVRSTEESMRMQIQDLTWLGLNWDEGVDPESLKDIGRLGPYRQSQRREVYQEYAQQLLEAGQAYYCFMSDQEIEVQREAAKKKGGALRVESPYRNLDPVEAKRRVDGGEPAVVRFKVTEEVKTYKINDLVRGEVSWKSDMVGDFVLLRSGGMPVYNFCCVIDDALMEMSHVFRAEDHLNNTLRQMMIYEALNFKLPQFAHMSFILGEDKQKLSKRHGATSVNDFSEKGILPEALNNYMALLGWSAPSGEEILSMDDMVQQFSADRLNSAPAVFDPVKLQWVNAMHLRSLPHAELWSRIKPFLESENISVSEDQIWLDSALGLLKQKMEVLKDAVDLFRPLDSGQFNLAPEAEEVLAWESTGDVISIWKSLIENLSEDTVSEEIFKQIQNGIKKQCGVKGKQLFQAIRVAVIGAPSGPDLALLVPLLKKSDLIERAKTVLAKRS